MRETTSLLPVAEMSRSTQRSKVRNLFFAFARSKAEVGAGLAVQYFPENLEPAQGHWREAVRLLAGLQQAHPTDEVVTVLSWELDARGFGEVAVRLRYDTIPRPIEQAARWA